MPKISALPPAGTLADDDETPFVDDSVGSTKKFTLAGLLVWLQSKVAWITHAMVANGFVVQVVQTNSSAVATGTGTIPFDDTIPQITEGNEYMTVVITPKSATNRLVIEGCGLYSISVANGNAICAIFQDAIANALAANTSFNAIASGRIIVPVSHDMVAGTTSAITFRFRMGNDSAATNTFNGNSPGTALFGGATTSWLKVTEYKA